MDIREFLLARIAEDEATARAAVDPSGWGSSDDGRWELVEVPYEGEWPRNPDAENALWADSHWATHASRHDPARILAECAAKRAIVEHWGPFETLEGPDLMIVLATVYRDHPDYQQEWAQEAS